LAKELGEEARMPREDPEECYAGFAAEVTEVDARVLERPEVRAFAIEMLQEAVPQGAVGWVEEVSCAWGERGRSGSRKSGLR